MLEKIAELIKEDEWDVEIEYICEAFGGVDGEVIKTEFSEGGRWSNFKIITFRVHNRYFKYQREVPATEQQEGGYFSRALWEVYPKEVTITKYLSKKSDPTIEWNSDD